jgi:integrase
VGRLLAKGKRIRKKVGPKAQARAVYERLKTESRLGVLVPRPVKKKDPTFRELAEMYARYAQIHHKRKGDDISRLRRWLDGFKDKPALSIKPYMVEEIIAKMLEEDYQPATIARALVTLKAIFNRAIKNEIIEKNPVARVSAPKLDKTVVRYPKPEQEERLFGVLPERLHAIVTVVLHTGIRQGELLMLNWNDVDFNAGTLFVRDRKSGESSHILMNSRIQDILLSLPSRENPEGAIFTDTLGGTDGCPDPAELVFLPNVEKGGFHERQKRSEGRKRQERSPLRGNGTAPGSAGAFPVGMRDDVRPEGRGPGGARAGMGDDPDLPPGHHAFVVEGFDLDHLKTAQYKACAQAEHLAGDRRDASGKFHGLAVHSWWKKTRGVVGKRYHAYCEIVTK